jgi:hypothetical protein
VLGSQGRGASFSTTTLQLPTLYLSGANNVNEESLKITYNLDSVQQQNMCHDRRYRELRISPSQALLSGLYPSSLTTPMVPYIVYPGRCHMRMGYEKSSTFGWAICCAHRGARFDSVLRLAYNGVCCGRKAVILLGRYRSGQPGQTVNLLAYAFAGSNPARPTKTICESPRKHERAPRRGSLVFSWIFVLWDLLPM